MKTISIEKFLDFKFLSNPRFSPDGRYIAFLVKQAFKDSNSYKSDIWIMDSPTKDIRRLTGMGDAGSFIWTSDGDLLFSAAREKAEKDVTIFYSIRPDGGEAAESFRIPLKGASIKALGGTSYAVTAQYDLKAADNKEEDLSYQVFDELPFWSNSDGYINGKRNRLYIFNSADSSLTPISDEYTDVEEYVTSDTYIAFSGTPYQSVKPRRPGIYSYNLYTKKLNCLLQPDTMETGAIEVFNGKLLVAASDGEEYGSDRYYDFYTFELEGGGRKKLADYEATIGYGSVGSDAKLGGGQQGKVVGSKYFFCSTVNNSTILRSVDTEGKIEDVFIQEGSCESFDIYEDKTIICGLYKSRLCELYDISGKQLTNINAAFYDNYNIVSPEFHSYTGGDGFEIHGWALKPADYHPGKSYPAILHIHGGPRTVFGDVYHHEMQMWAHSGYFVFFCNPRGSDGRGNEFGYISGKYGSVDYENIMEFADEMLQKYPDADRASFGVTGGSYGGFMTNWIICHTDRFKAAVSQRSISNWIAMEHTSDIGHFFVESQLLATTRTDPEKVWSMSPLKYAHKAKTPTLFIHSERDHRCWLVEGISMYSALKMNGTDTRLCLFHEENHELSRSGKPKNRISRMAEILNWFDKYLK